MKENGKCRSLKSTFIDVFFLLVFYSFVYLLICMYVLLFSILLFFILSFLYIHFIHFYTFYPFIYFYAFCSYFFKYVYIHLLKIIFIPSPRTFNLHPRTRYHQKRKRKKILALSKVILPNLETLRNPKKVSHCIMRI